MRNRAGRIGELGAQSLLRALPDEQFGVPLHAEEEGRARIFHGLHDSALVAGNDLETAPESVHRLVMERVHSAGIALHDVVEAASLGDVDGLAGRVVYWENNGSTHLGWVNMTEPLGEWTLVWSVTLLPEKQTLLNIRPALIEGVGTVWMDDMKLINLIENLDHVQVPAEE